MGSDRDADESANTNTDTATRTFEEYDPEAEFRDPDSDSITIPEVSTGDVDPNEDLESELEAKFDPEGGAVSPTPEESAIADAPDALLKEFWALVLVLNGALLAYSLAALYLIFEGQTTYATYLFAAGALLSVFAVRRYRTIERRDFETEGEETDADDEGTDENDGSNADDGDESPAETAADGESGAESDGDPSAN